jgi:hypothetical protein
MEGRFVQVAVKKGKITLKSSSVNPTINSVHSMSITAITQCGSVV